MISLVFSDDIRRHAQLIHAWKERASYMLIIPEDKLTDIQGERNDSIFLKFSTRAKEEYGSLFLNLTFNPGHGQYLIYLLDDKEAIMKEKTVTAPGIVEFNYVLPRKYIIKAIEDRNLNGKWDAGDYSSRTQPEKVFYLPGEVQIRANWEMTEEWELQ